MKALFNKSKISPLYLAQWVKSLKSVTESKEEFEKIKKDFIPETKIKKISQILKGLEQEDEFAIVCKLIRSCTSIVKLEQTSIIKSNEIIPDFIATFEPGCSVAGKSKKEINVKYNCFVEVKSCKGNSFKISKNDFNKRKKFADRYNLPLIFAIRFMSYSYYAVWALINANDLQRKTYKLHITEFSRSLRHVLLDDYFLMPAPNLHLIRYYSNKIKPSYSTSRHEKFGYHLKTYFAFKDTQIEISDSDSLFMIAFLDLFETEQIDTINKRDILCQIVRLNPQGRSLLDILFRMNRLITDNAGNEIFDATRILSNINNKENVYPLLGREIIETYLSKYNNKSPVFMKIGFEKPEKQLATLLSLADYKV